MHAVLIPLETLMVAASDLEPIGKVSFATESAAWVGNLVLSATRDRKAYESVTGNVYIIANSPEYKARVAEMKAERKSVQAYVDEEYAAARSEFTRAQGRSANTVNDALYALAHRNDLDPDRRIRRIQNIVGEINAVLTRLHKRVNEIARE